MPAFTLNALIHGWSGLSLVYGSVQAPMLAGMVRARAGWQQLLLSPVAAVPVTALAGAGLAMLNPVLHGLGLAPSLLEQLALGGVLSAGLGYAAGRTIARSRPSHYRYVRGANVVDGASSASPRDPRSIAAGSSNVHAAQLTLAGHTVPEADEAKHFKFIGTTGTGKSTAIGELLAGALRRGDRAVIADPDGGYLRRFFDPDRGDILLNPFDQRSVKWDLFGEISQPYDVEQLARSLLPEGEGAERTWRGYARTFLTAVARQAHAAGVRDVGELYRLLVIAPTDELRALTDGTPAQPFLEQHNGRMFDSIRSVTSSAVGSLEHIARHSGSPFSVREWVRRGRAGQGGVLFMPYRAPQIAALRGAVSAWMRIAIFEAMDGPEQDQRLWFVVDELDALGQIDGLKDALARVRKFGGRCILGLQSIAQVASTYGAGDAHTIVENCGNSLILRCSASEGGGTSRFASTLIGQREVVRTTLSRSRRPGEFLSSLTRGEHYSVESAVMDSQIEQLPDLVGYLKFASQDRWARVGLTPVRRALAEEPSRAVPAYIPVQSPQPSAAPPSRTSPVGVVPERPVRAARVKSSRKASPKVSPTRRRAAAPRAAPAARADAGRTPPSPEPEL